MAENSWVKEFPGMVVVSNEAGIIVEMNERAVEWFADRGGRGLMGKSLLDVHKEPSQDKIKEMMESKRSNAYTIEKDGARMLIYQAPWYREGKLAGLVEFGLEVPADIPHHAREAKRE
jgi:transcriptional regulator with PAS, ATPase and Fis domain